MQLSLTANTVSENDLLILRDNDSVNKFKKFLYSNYYLLNKTKIKPIPSEMLFIPIYFTKTGKPYDSLYLDTISVTKFY